MLTRRRGARERYLKSNRVEQAIMPFNTMTFEHSDNVAVVTINRPNAANALNAEMAAELCEIATDCSKDDRIRAVLITATGKMFCAGGDLAEVHSAGAARAAHMKRMATNLHTALELFANMNAPVIVAVNGTAAGAGFSLALSGDYVIASENAKFVSAYTAAGLTPDGSSTYFLAKHIGLLRAKELILMNRQLSAEEALAWGVVNRIVPPTDLHSHSMDVAMKFASGPTKAFGGVKRLLASGASEALERQLQREAQSIADMLETHDGPHGIESFLKKEKPRFVGR
jgi:2-(1,2-epoxy-1,2-dihydrophenyl)acetyl-CoA isomerase